MFKYACLIFILLIQYSHSAKLSHAKWYNDSLPHQVNVNFILKELQKSKTGQSLVRKFEQKATSLSKTTDELIIGAELSYTDSTILRSFKEHNPLEVDYRTRSEIYLNKNLPLHFAVLDLAHEMVHFLERSNLNPYIDDFDVLKFIENSIEGEGGEADAFLVECEVDQELFGSKNLKSKRFLSEKCGPLNDHGHHEKSHIVKEFYKLGNYYKAFKDEIEKETVSSSEKVFSLISRGDPSFISSVHSMPYPLAGYFEYQSIKGAACKNDRRRFQYLQSAVSRFPHSEIMVEDFKKNFNKRCEGFESL